jgi:uncharacterized protein (DUF433 family)
MQALDRITVDPAVMNGQPCLRGMRITVRRVLEIAALYPDAAERRKDYPDLEDDNVAQAIRHAASASSDFRCGVILTIKCALFPQPYIPPLYPHRMRRVLLGHRPDAGLLHANVDGYASISVLP